MGAQEVIVEKCLEIVFMIFLVKKVAAFYSCPKTLPAVKEFWINFLGRGNLKTAYYRLLCGY